MYTAGFETAIPANEGPQTPRLKPSGLWDQLSKTVNVQNIFMIKLSFQTLKVTVCKFSDIVAADYSSRAIMYKKDVNE